MDYDLTARAICASMQTVSSFRRVQILVEGWLKGDVKEKEKEQTFNLRQARFALLVDLFCGLIPVG